MKDNFTKLEQTLLKFVWNHRRPQKAKEILKNVPNITQPKLDVSCAHLLNYITKLW